MSAINDALVAVPASKLLQKCRCHEDIVNICRELGKLNIFIRFILGFFFPNEVGFDGKFFLQWGAGKKKVI